MYNCPLCVGNTANYKQYSSLEALQAHFDLSHPPNGDGLHKKPPYLRELENRIDSLVNLYASRQARRDTFDNGQEESRLSIFSYSNNRGLLQKYASDYDFISAENDYLKRQMRHSKSEWLREMENCAEKCNDLERKLNGLVNFLHFASKEQDQAKINLQKFMNRLIGDLEYSELKLEKMAVEQKRSVSQPLFVQINDRPYHSYGQRSSQHQGLLLPKFSDVSVAGMPADDSGYEDKTEKPVYVVQNTRKNIIQTPAEDDWQNGSGFSGYPYNMPTFMSFATDTENQWDENMRQLYANQDAYFGSMDLALMLVLRKLDAVDLLTCIQVSRRWKSISSHPLVWRSVTIRNRIVNKRFLKAVAVYCTQTVYLTLVKVGARRTKGSAAKYGGLENGIDKILHACGDALLFLKIVDCAPALTDRTLWLAACHCHSLEKIVYLSDAFPVNAPVLWALGASCRAIEVLILPPLVSNARHMNGYFRLTLDDDALLMIARCFPTTLKTLCVGGPHVTVAGLMHIAKCCQWLEALELDHCEGITESAAKSLCAEGLHVLQILNITHCKVTAEALLYFSRLLPQLRTMRVVFSPRDFSSMDKMQSFVSNSRIFINEHASLRMVLQLEERKTVI